MKRTSRSLALVGLLCGLLAIGLGCSPDPEPPGPKLRPSKSGPSQSSPPKLVIREGDYQWSFSPRKGRIKEKAGKSSGVIAAPMWEGEFTINPDGTVVGKAQSKAVVEVVHCEKKPLETIPDRLVPARSTLTLNGRVRGLKLVLKLKRTAYKAPFREYGGGALDACPNGPIPEGAKIMELIKRSYGDPTRMEITIKPDKQSLCAGPDWKGSSSTELGIESIQYDLEMCPKDS